MQSSDTCCRHIFNTGVYRRFLTERFIKVFIFNQKLMLHNAGLTCFVCTIWIIKVSKPLKISLEYGTFGTLLVLTFS